MDITQGISKKSQGQQLQNAEKLVLISKLVDELCEGYSSTYALAKKLHVSRQTIDTYRPLADDLIRKTRIDRNQIRALQIKRTYSIIEDLMNELVTCESVRDKALIYAQIHKFSNHLALITGLNTEVQINVDPTKLVIVRSKQRERERDEKQAQDDADSAATSVIDV